VLLSKALLHHAPVAIAREFTGGAAQGLLLTRAGRGQLPAHPVSGRPEACSIAKVRLGSG
jgi:hypothetical protein